MRAPLHILLSPWHRRRAGSVIVTGRTPGRSERRGPGAREADTRP